MAELDSSGFTFTSQPTKKETERFEYVSFDYLTDNPGYISQTFKSYIGTYIDENGNKSGT